MKTKQDIQLELLQEIDEISSKNGLRYILVGRNSLNVYHNHTIKEGPRLVAVAMTQGDIDRFCKIIEEKYSKNRYVEGIFNNPHFIPFYVTYGNKNTANFHMVNLNKNTKHGIRVRIYPIIKSMERDGTKIKGWTRRLSRERKFRKFVNKRIDNPKYWYMKKGLKVMSGAYSFSGGTKRYYKNVKRNTFIDKWEDIQDYEMVRINKKEISTEHFKELEKTDVDGIKLYLPKNQDAYFSEVYGEDFKEIPIKAKKQKMRVVEDTERPFEEIYEETKDTLDEIRCAHEEIVWTRRKSRDEAQTVANLWRLVKMTNKQLELREFFDENLDDFLKYDLDDEEQLLELYDELKPVISPLRRYSKHGMTFSINPQADDLIKKVLIKTEREKLVERIEKIAKKQYFVE